MSRADELVVEYNRKPWMTRAALKLALPDTRVLVVNAAVYTGKTNFYTAVALDNCIENPKTTHWWIASLDWQIGPFWDKFEPHAKWFGARTRTSPYRRALFGNGTRLFCVSGKSIGTLASYHPDFLYVDEAAKLAELAANLIVIRSLKAQKTVFMSSANATTHWSRWVKWAREKKDGWDLITCTTEEAGILPKAEIERIRRSVPEDFARQELDAVILAGAGNVFKHVAERAIGSPRLPGYDKAGRPFEYLVTYDPAKQSDFGAVSVWRGKRQVRAYRWAETDYTVQAKLVADICREYHCAMCIIDATGPGEAVYEMLRGESAAKEPSFDVWPFYFNAKTKPIVVNAAVLAFERGEIELIAKEHGEEYEACVAEVGAYQRTRSPAGLTYVYSAPEGEHDDLVSTILLKMAIEIQPRAMVLDHNRPGQA